MTAMETDTNVRACGCAPSGRHKNSCPLKQPDVSDPASDVENATASVPAAETWYGLPIMPDHEMEQYGGDLAALESYSRKSGRQIATIRTARPVAGMSQPDLNYKGMLVSRHNPAAMYHFAYLDEDGSASYRITFQTLRQRGFRPVTVADFHVHSTLRGLFIPDDGTANGRLSLGGALKGATTVIYAQDEANWRRWRGIEREVSDSIQLTAEQRAAEMQAGLARDGFGGVTAISEFEQ